MTDVSLFDYNLPEDLVARHPAPERDASRMLVLHRSDSRREHTLFRDLPAYLRPGDCLVINDSKVLPARLLGQRIPSGGKIEALLLRREDERRWRAMVRPGKKIQKGQKLLFESADGAARLEAEIVGYADEGERILQFTWSGDWWELLESVGHTPLPPYILKARKEHDGLRGDKGSWHDQAESPEDRERYQTVYAQAAGSVAAPTAGLHFTQNILTQLEKHSIAVARVTLHVGDGTFRPVTTETAEEHVMHEEEFEIGEPACQTIARARERGGRIIAVGTTAVRVLESVSDESGTPHPARASTRLLIVPGYRFRALDALLTNFHLPRSTLLMLVSAFAGRERILEAYSDAVARRYRFYSYGDAMLIV